MFYFFLFFLFLGIISIISQVTIIRELMAAFFGNELFVGIVLGIWLLGTGFGSLLILKIFPGFKTKKACFIFEIFTFLLLPLIIFFIRFFVGTTLLPGEVVSFFQALLFTFLILFPFCFLLGGLFSLGARTWVRTALAFLVSRAYLLETIGFAIGGVLFNFFLISSTFPLPSNLNLRTLKFRYPNLVETVNSRYGSIIVTKTDNQFNFYESGSLLGTNEEKEESEYLVHTIFAFHPKPKIVLLIGGGLNGPLFEILKYESVQKIDYVELDPKLVEVQKKYLPTDLAKVLKNPKIKIHFLDGRRFLKLSQKKYDIIIFNLPNPSTGLLNRLYTLEAFLEAKEILTKEGILAFTLDVPPDYLSQEAKDLVASLKKTVKEVFPYTLILPGETTILFINSSKSFPPKEKVVAHQIKTNYFTLTYLFYLLSGKKIAQIRSLLAKTKAKINTDFHPAAYFYQAAFWQTTQSFLLAKILKEAEKISWPIFAIFSILLLFFLKTKISSVVLTMGLASLTLMTIEVLIIFLFQSELGYLYSKIALIFTAILISMGLGNFVGTKIKTAKKALGLIKFLTILYLLIFFPMVKNLPSEPIFYLLGGIIGSLVGAVFPLTNKIYLRTKEKVSVLYTADLFGALFGATLPSIFFIPLFGIQKTIFLLTAFNIFFF